MVKQSHNNGFTLVEILIVCLCSVIIILVFAIPMVSSQLIEDSFTDFQYCQLEAMAEKTRCTVNENLWFNKNGNINRAQTQQFGRKTCVFQLGFGRFKCER